MSDDTFNTRDWLASLPRKRVAVGVLLRNMSGELLLVEPSYRRDGWLLPGGTVERFESPMEGARREVQEELSVRLPRLQHVATSYGRLPNGGDEMLHLFFDGGTLDVQAVAAIKLQAAELTRMAFLPWEAALERANAVLRIKLTKVMEAWRGGPNYFEGEFPDERD